MPIRRSNTASTSTTADVPANAVTVDVTPVPAEPKPKRSRRAKAPAEPANAVAVETAAEQQLDLEAQPAAPAPEAPEPEAPEPEAPLAPANAVSALVLPPLDAPAVNAQEPAISYKIDFSDRNSWHASTDGGETKASIGSAAVAGAPVDLQLQISKARRPSGFYTHDYRLRVAFYQADGQLAELNLTAINVNPSGELYVTSPARSLVGALLAISDSEDDMAAFCEAARFTIKPGSGRGVFVECDLANGGRWIAMASATNTTGVSKTADGFMAQLALIKARFRGCGLLLTSQAISGHDGPDDAIDVEADPA